MRIIKFIIISIIIFPSIGLPKRKFKYNPKIYGGFQVQPGELPHHAAVGVKLGGYSELFCGGSILNGHFVLTAANCKEYFVSIFSIQVFVGSVSLHDSYGNFYKIKKDYPHPKWSSVEVEYDMMLLETELEIRLKPGFVEAIQLPDKHSFIPKPQDQLVTCGWGLEAPGRNSENLKKLFMYIVPEKECVDTWGESPEKRICATSRVEGWGTCTGDIGAGLVFNKRLVGVLSYGTTECDLNEPEVYSDVHAYLDWIHDTMHP